MERLVLGKTVTVAYTQTDQYGRIVGAVFTDNCQYVNLEQVATGMAWFYKAYQCEISADLRAKFSQAQDSVVSSKLGLWSETDPEAPWFYRNGVEPETPVCKRDTPTWEGGFALTPVDTNTAANSALFPYSPNGGLSAGSNGSSSGGSSPTCYIGPRGGRYTISANGTKIYNC